MEKDNPKYEKSKYTSGSTEFVFFLSFGTKVFSTKHLDYSTVNIDIVVHSMSYGIKLK